MDKTIEALTRAYQEVKEGKFIIPEEIPANERTAFHGAAAAAAKAGKSHFNFNGKKHPVTMKKDTATAIADDVKEDLEAEAACDRSVLKASKKKGKDDPTQNKGETAAMNPKMDTAKTTSENIKSADKKPEVYVDDKGKKRTRMVPVDKEVVKKESTDMSIREKLMAVLEKKSHGNLDNKQPHDDLDSPGAKKMRDDTKDDGSFQDLEKQSHDDASKAGRVTKASAPNPTDKNAAGDKNVINPVKDTTKAGKVKESFSKQVHSIAAAYQSMYEEVDMDYHMDKAADHRAQANYHSDKAKDHRDAGASDHAAHHMMAADMHKSAAKKHDKAADTGSQASSATAKTLSRKADGKTAEVKKKFS